MKYYWIRSCRQINYLKCTQPDHSLIRQFTSRPPPGFGSSTPSSTAAPKSNSKRPLEFGDGKHSAKKPDFTGQKSPAKADKTKVRTKAVLKILAGSFLAFLAYEVYVWDTNPYRSRILNPVNFAPFILKKRDKISSTSSILHLKSLPKGQNTDTVDEAWQIGVWSVQAMQPELQIARSYTPLPPLEDAEPEELRLFVRKEPQGEVSSMLHRINRGTLVHLRGPQIEYRVPHDADEVVFLAGGTGIAPALQVAHILYNHRTSASGDGPKMRILWANRKREDSYLEKGSRPLEQVQPVSAPEPLFPDAVNRRAPDPLLDQSQTALVAELESLKTRYSGKVEIDYLVDEENTYITQKLLGDRLSAISRKPDSVDQDHDARRRLLLVSGPEGFVDYYAGRKGMKGGKETQGPLGGILQGMDLQGWEIWKL